MPEDVLARCWALLALLVPDLADLAEQWLALPEAVKAGIRAMIAASTTPPGEQRRAA